MVEREGCKGPGSSKKRGLGAIHARFRAFEPHHFRGHIIYIIGSYNRVIFSDFARAEYPPSCGDRCAGSPNPKCKPNVTPESELRRIGGPATGKDGRARRRPSRYIGFLTTTRANQRREHPCTRINRGKKGKAHAAPASQQFVAYCFNTGARPSGP